MSDKLYVDVFEENANRPLPIRREYCDCSGGGLSYSLEEQDTGLTWIDGKKIYQKTILLDSPFAACQFNGTNHQVNGMERVIEVHCMHYKLSEGGYLCYPIPYARPTSDSDGYMHGCMTTPNEVRVIPFCEMDSDTEIYATIRYTCSGR